MGQWHRCSINATTCDSVSPASEAQWDQAERRQSVQKTCCGPGIDVTRSGHRCSIGFDRLHLSSGINGVRVVPVRSIDMMEGMPLS